MVNDIQRMTRKNVSEDQMLAEEDLTEQYPNPKSRN
jgi:hypothetical protein